ncbi:hypothetical protein GCM10022286_30960 [Gryllotalpicola daejeonensis]|uniref:Uncharacterized protein n=1 Tax=Gryllotalpicola daejeonensis TaxID=993087 RepID=A0ABP7ZPC1_9MICO
MLGVRVADALQGGDGGLRELFDAEVLVGLVELGGDTSHGVRFLSCMGERRVIAVTDAHKLSARKARRGDPHRHFPAWVDKTV